MTEVMNAALSVLMIVTSSAEMGEKGEATGVWLEEMAVPYMVLQQAGITVDIVTVSGGKLPLDPRSLDVESARTPMVQSFMQDAKVQAALGNSPALADVDVTVYDAVFFPGGHGTMWDFPVNQAVALAVRDVLAAEKPLVAVCHGPAALVSARFDDGTPVVAGRRITAFSDSEEQAVGLMNVVPFALESRLRELGADVTTGQDFAAHVIRDGNLITGQNPASSAQAALLLIEALTEHSHAESTAVGDH